MPSNERIHPTATDVLAPPPSTQGEVERWLEGDINTDSALASDYVTILKMTLDELKSDEAIDDGSSPNRTEARNQMRMGLATLAQQLASESYSRSKVTTEIPGIAPVHTVSERDIETIAARFEASDPEYKGYQGSELIESVHNLTIQTAVLMGQERSSGEQE